MMKKIILGLLIVVVFNSNAQPSIQWQRCLGGTNNDYAQCIQTTIDGGFIVAGTTRSNNGDVSGNNGNEDVWIVKTSSSGNIEWQKCLGGSNDDSADSIIITPDGGYIVAGYTYSNNGDVFGNHGDADVWVVKLSNIGNIQWQKCIGGSGEDRSKSIQSTPDGGFIISGFTSSNDGDITGNHGSWEALVFKINQSGILQWQRCYGGSNEDFAKAIYPTTDGGYVIAGYTGSFDGDVTGYLGSTDAWVVKITITGTIQWQKCLGSYGADEAEFIEQTSDGGFLMVGNTNSTAGDVIGNHGGFRDSWVVKLNNLGAIQWQRCLGGSGIDYGFSLTQTSDGGAIILNCTTSSDGDVSGYSGGGAYDAWLVKLNNLGNIEWQECIGGSNTDFIYNTKPTIDNGYILAGSTSSVNGDVSGNQGGSDAWVVKLTSFLGQEEPSIINRVSLYPNPVTNVLNLIVGSNIENSTYILTDLKGKIIRQGIIDKNVTSINVEYLSKGVYFIKIAGNEVIKFIKE